MTRPKKTLSRRLSDGTYLSSPLSRVAHIVDAVAYANNGLTLNQISQALDLPPSTTHRIVRNLVTIGYLASNSQNKTYRIGQRLFRIIHANMGAQTVQSLVEHVLAGIVSQVRQVSYLSQLVGDHVRLLAYVMPKGAEGTLIQPGETSPIHATAAGKAIFAYQPEELIEWHLQRPLPKYQEKTITDPDAVRAELSKVRDQGYATSDSEYEEGACSISCPVEIPKIGIAFAVSIAGFKSQLYKSRSVEDYLEVLHDGAQKLSDILSVTEFDRSDVIKKIVNVKH